MTDERIEKWREAVELFGRPVIHDHYGTGVINGVWFHEHQGILFNVRFDDSGIDDEWLEQVKLACAFCRHPKESHNDGKFQQMPCSFTDVDSHDESEVRCMCYGWCDTREEAEALAIGIESGSPLGGAKAKVLLFRQSGKYYCEEEWRIPYGAIGPYDMERSLDFRRIEGGPVLVDSQEPWGYPHLFPGVEITKEFDCANCGHPKEEHEVFESNKFLRTRETCWAEISSEPSKILIGAPEIIRCNCRRYSPKKDSK